MHGMTVEKERVFRRATVSQERADQTVRQSEIRCEISCRSTQVAERIAVNDNQQKRVTYGYGRCEKTSIMIKPKKNRELSWL